MALFSSFNIASSGMTAQRLRMDVISENIANVLTTGATITACADVFRDVEGVRISVLTLAVANF